MNARQSLTKKKGKKRVGKKKSYKRTETHDLYDGDVQLFRCGASGRIWQFQIWVTNEQRVFRKSTKKRNLEEAIRVAKDYYLDVQVKLRNETPVFPYSCEELAIEWLEKRQKDVDTSFVTEGRWKVLRTQLKHWLNFVGHKTKINDIKKTRYDDYYNHRRTTNPEVTNGTLINESGTIRSVYKWAISRGLVHYTDLPDFPKVKKGTQRRRIIDLQEYRTIYQHLRSDEFLKDCSSDDQMFRKQMLYLTLVLANTGIRLGECRRLQWRNVDKIYKPKGKKRTQWSVGLSLDDDQTKNHKARKITGRRGDVFVDLKDLTDFTNRNDFVFCDFHTGESLLEVHRHKLYKHWRKMLVATGLDQQEEPPTFYHLRHFYATMRIKADVKPIVLRDSMGCSMKYLEEHYIHGDVHAAEERTMLVKSQKKFDYDEDGVLIVDA